MQPQLTFCFLVFYISTLICQNAHSNIACDCSKALNISISDSLIIGPTLAPSCSGIEEINSKDKEYSFVKEHHTAWYLIKIEKCGTLAFTLTPQQKTDDYDFMLFKADSSSICKLIKEDRTPPIRSNVSRNDSTGIGETGLSILNKNSFSKKGRNAPFSKPIEVRGGEKYILVLDNVYKNGKGFSIRFSNSSIQEFVVYTFDFTTKKPLMTDNFYNNAKDQFMHVEYSGKYYASYRYNFGSKDSYGYTFDKEFEYVRIAKAGYLPDFIHKTEMTCENNNSKLFLKKAYKDSVYTLKGIVFRADLSIDVEASRIALATYKEFLRKNVRVHFEVIFIDSDLIRSAEDFKKAATSFRNSFLNQPGVSGEQIKITGAPSPNSKSVKGRITIKILKT